jgi:hypothetical protein
VSHSILTKGASHPFLPKGKEIAVNTFTQNTQDNSDVRWLDNGNFVVVWESRGHDGSEKGVYAQLFDRTGSTIGGEAQVNTQTKSDQDLAKIIPTTGGGFMVVFEGADNGTLSSGIVAQRFDATGAKLGLEFNVNTFEVGSQSQFEIGEISGGGTVVVWNSNPQDGSSAGVFGQRFGATGNPIGTEFQVNTTTFQSQLNATVTGLASGGFVVTWDSPGQVGTASDRGVYGQIYTAGGVAIGGEFKVHDSALVSELNEGVVALSGGGFVVGYREGNTTHLIGKIYDAAGNAVPGGEVFLSEHQGQQQGSNLQLVALENDKFVAVWQSPSLAGDVAFRVFDADGTPRGGGTGHSINVEGQVAPFVKALPDGGFAIIFQSNGLDGGLAGVAISRFSPGGNGYGGALQVETNVNTQTRNNQYDPAFDVDGDGNIVVSWTSDQQDGSLTGIYAQTLITPVFGTFIEDTMTGTSGGDYLAGWQGSDTLIGRGGNDWLEGGEEPDFLFGGKGNDRLIGGYREDDLYGGAGCDRLIGEWSSDRLFGGAGGDKLYGEARGDILKGGGGHDLLFGGKGNDRLTGGNGEDAFVFNRKSGRDVITDFTQGTDFLRLNDALWTGSLSATEVVTNFATVKATKTILEFSGGEKIVLEGVTDLALLASDILIF